MQHQHLTDPLRGSGPAFEEAEGLNLRRYLLLPWRYKWLLLGILAIALSATALVLSQIAPRYAATALLLIEPQERNVVDLEAVIAGADTSDPEALHAEVIILESRELAEKTSESLKLFKPGVLHKAALTRTSYWTHLNPLSYVPEKWRSGFNLGSFVPAAWQDWLDAVKEKPISLQKSEADEDALARARATGLFQSVLSVSSIPRTRVVEVRVESGNPQFAAEAANAHAEQYVRNTLEVKFAATDQANAWLSERLAGLRENMQVAEAEVEALRRAANLVAGRDASLVAQEMSQVNTQLIAAKAETAEYLTKMRQIDRLRSTGNDAALINEVINSAFLHSLREKESTLKQQLAEASAEFGDLHPIIINLKAEIDEVKFRVEGEIDKVVSGIRNQVDRAKARQNELQTALNKLTDEVGEINDAQVKLSVLEREANANRVMYDTFLARYKETSLQQDVQQPDARIISRAQVPGAPFYPNEKKSYLMAGGAALAVGLALILLMEKMKPGFRTLRDLEDQTGLPVFAMVPEVGRKERASRSMVDFAIEEKLSRYAESLNRILLARPLSLDKKKKPISLLITSSLPKEGKTTTVISLARQASIDHRVLLIDGDLRNPQITSTLRLGQSPGLAEYFWNGISFSDAIQKDPRSNLHVMSAGIWRKDELGLKPHDALAMALEAAKSQYDMIFIDSPPVLAVSEALQFAKLADQTVMLVRWSKTPQETVLAGLNELRQIEANLAGIVMTLVDVKEQASIGYGEYGYYSDKVRDYYS